ncbi:hypothetical protein MHB43_08010 [Paenibacillus sp. FSL H8-0317]|uniref:hypothetical protein n=1 Tax=unclassified Paenibacillus TaxID=185978 RepID=UPI0030CAA6E3
MGVAVSFKLQKIIDGKATYNYGLNFNNFEGEIEIDLSETSNSLTEDENRAKIKAILITPCNGEWSNSGLALRVVSKIYRSYIKEQKYIESGGHYAG